MISDKEIERIDAMKPEQALMAFKQALEKLSKWDLSSEGRRQVAMEIKTNANVIRAYGGRPQVTVDVLSSTWGPPGSDDPSGIIFEETY
jgi:hypothetical protein